MLGEFYVNALVEQPCLRVLAPYPQTAKQRQNVIRRRAKRVPGKPWGERGGSPWGSGRRDAAGRAANLSASLQLTSSDLS